MNDSDRQYFLARGQGLEVGANTPLWLHQGPQTWVVLSGSLDVFAIAMAEGQPAGPRIHLLRAQEGQAVFGLLPDQGRETTLVAVGVPGTKLATLTRAAFLPPDQDLPRRETALALLETWVQELYHSLPAPPRPVGLASLEPDRPVRLAAGQAALGYEPVVWLQASQGEAQVWERPELALRPQNPPSPLPAGAWLRAGAETSLEVFTTDELLAQDPDLAALDHFHGQLLVRLQGLGEQRRKSQAGELTRREAQSRAALGEALARLARVLEPTSGPTGYVGEMSDGLLAACQALAEKLGIPTHTLPADWDAGQPSEALERLARAWRVRVRPVSLDAQWWIRDNGPLLAFAKDDGRPLALLPVSPRAYQVYDPQLNASHPLDAAEAAGLDQVGYMLYRPLPWQKLGAWELVKFGCHGLAGDIWMVALMGLAGGLLGLVTPVATGLLFDSIIPSSDRSQLWQMVIALAVVAVAGSMFRLTRNLAVLRVEGRMDAEVQSGVWDRLLSLPVPFFRGYSAGDLANRANGVSAMRRVLSGTMLNSTLTGIFSLFSFALLFYYDWTLALISSTVVLLGVIIAAILGFIELRYQRPLLDTQGRIAGLVLQIIAGIDKLHVAGVEERSFLSWSRLFGRQKELSYQSTLLQKILAVVNSGLPILGSGLMFYWMVFQGHGLSTGDFMAFTTAFGNFLSGMLALTTSFMSVLQIAPLYQRAKPILETLPEFDQASSDPGQLSGTIELSHLSFRYDPEGPLILNDVDVSILPGQFVALAGPSGSGKSTLLRLLLGFEKPTSGAVYYDGQDLEDLDKQAVRRQLGVVLQSGKLTPGDIRSNILGASNLGDDAAWEAAEMAGLAEDIKAMPMGMHTVVSEGSGTLSGGQAQRLLIARAMVKRPRILFLDEATSALDNRVQAVVTESMEKLKATRVVIAHRLSTIRHADLIVVVAAGRVVEQGNYDELMTKDGLFAELARRQMA